MALSLYGRRIMKYKLNMVSLAPDERGMHVKIGMITQQDDNGKYIKHIKIAENEDLIINMLKGLIIEVKDG